jgi:uncharacterized membrane protein
MQLGDRTSGISKNEEFLKNTSLNLLLLNVSRDVEAWSMSVSIPDIKGVTMATIYLSIPLVTHGAGWGDNYTVHVARIMRLYFLILLLIPLLAAKKKKDTLCD